ncbi:DUF6807 domain-containing protein [Mariniblastus fucicola]|uniref:Methane oxygenase PmoA n=1 Tax=Mariniblastus fucicola TaxID=980251 RepID=A0A5B9PM04_9BACT|nr:PmoA family protein [Mariniblastus fucicola]QEG23323.1 hypothetical protein MFFC18_32200 [Mariniblastus fucicola]
MTRFLFLSATFSVIAIGAYVAPLQGQQAIQISQQNETIAVSVGGELFTAYNFTDTAKPFLYPVLGPSQIRMTRDFPMKKTAGEADDHPHHKSIWIGHEVNDIDFWTCRGGAKIVVDGEPTIDREANSITANSSWIDAGQNVVCRDSTKWSFGADEKSRWIDCVFTLAATEGPITIDDTKEGTVAIRTHPDLRLNPDARRGVEKVFGNVVNSQGTEGVETWGQSSAWLLYSGTIESKPASLLILDHPTNFRYPTTWHARDYGLISANPFGLHDFLEMEEHAGAVKLAKGQSLTLRYRFVFFAEAVNVDDAKSLHAKFSNSDANGD